MRGEDDFDLEVTGEIPAGLAGAFYRNGPNPQFDPRDDYHWFAGDGMIHAFFVEDGKVALPQPLGPHAQVAGRERRRPRACSARSAIRMTTDPSVIGQDSGVANTNIVWHAGPPAGAGGGPQAVRTRSRDPGIARLCSSTTAAASPPIPRSIPRPARWSGSAIRPADTPLNATGLLRRHRRGRRGASAATTSRRPTRSMVHDFLVTRRHALFPILPLTGSLERAMTGGPAFAWEPERAPSSG